MCFVSDDFRIIAMQSIFDECAWLTISAFLLSSMIVWRNICQAFFNNGKES